MEPPNWKKWDEFLVDAWEKDMHMFTTVLRFLEPYGFFPDQLMNEGFVAIFSAMDINGRSPKNHWHLGVPVKAFFYSFFPEVGEMLWSGKKDLALKKLRSYRVDVGSRPREGRELNNLKRDMRRKTSPVLPLIQGTNAIGVRQARRSLSDWGTTKPPSHMRNKRI